MSGEKMEKKWKQTVEKVYQNGLVCDHMELHMIANVSNKHIHDFTNACVPHVKKSKFYVHIIS